jgi:lipoprotein-anchoring transpeptidase ErfK/SrfK
MSAHAEEPADGSSSTSIGSSISKAPAPPPMTSSAPPPEGPLLGARAFATTVYDKPNKGSAKLGYLRVGALIGRSEEPAGKSGCPGGWYGVEPRGFVCLGEEGTIDLDDPLLRAASVRPRLDRPLPYRYGFVRAVAPLYLRVPTAERQFKSEFQLKEHLEWFAQHHSEVQTAGLGAWDVPVDELGRAVPGKRLGELGREKNSAEMGLGELFGGTSDDDPWPFWLRENERLIPNVSGFDVPEFAVFADRARRHTGLAFVGSFATDEHYLKRRFSITTDLRLAPATKVKPDSASPWHGVEIGGDIELPFVITSRRGVEAYRIVDGQAEPAGKLARRSAHALAGKVRKVAGERYLKLADERWVKDADVGMVVKPGTWPTAAKKGEKWIEVDLSEQVLVLWEGDKAVFATLVSTGKPALGDPEKTTATPRGQFRIFSKHISATMDSDEGAHERNPSLSVGDDGYVPVKGDGAYGKTLRRGHGLFKLRDVPHIQYFEKNYAIHGAYWHDVFGIARSHGCINLAPADSLRVFQWTGPVLPEGWHGVTDANAGTVVVIHK